MQASSLRFRQSHARHVLWAITEAVQLEQQILIVAQRINLAPEDVPVIPSRFRLQWEAAQNAHVLLYPEGMVKLSQSAAEILKRVDGVASVSAIVQGLEQTFPGADLRSDVVEFLSTAYERGWIVLPVK